MCCLQEVRWRGHGSRMLEMEERFKMCCFESEDKVSDVENMVKEERNVKW